MKIALITDSYLPECTSAAVQIRDLSREFVRQGHQVTVIVPNANILSPSTLEELKGVEVLRLRAFKTRDTGHIFRLIFEILMPFCLFFGYRNSHLFDQKWDGIVWYSPSIFHGPFVGWLKKKSNCNSYLIVRDIFPEWAVDIGIMRRGLRYWFLKMVAQYQYSLADTIGVQSQGNLTYFIDWSKTKSKSLEILPNWSTRLPKKKCSINIANTKLAGRKIFVYAGNMGLAQGMDIIIDLAESLKDRNDLGFMFIGRGSEVARLKDMTKQKSIDNILFFNEIDPDEIPSLYEQCVAGIIALSHDHQSHNIPGKFISYMQNGLPCFANINAGNDLAELIRTETVGQVCESNRLEDLIAFLDDLLVQIDQDSGLENRCMALYDRHYDVQNTVKQIVSAV